MLSDWVIYYQSKCFILVIWNNTKSIQVIYETKKQDLEHYHFVFK